jgi:hypothetical protein
LASAFAQKVREPQQSDVSAAIEVLSAGAAEEWYVGINGVPLGPVRLSTLRQKAQQGLIDEESLVWRAGFEEWLPLRTFPELLVLVRESREMVGRASYLPSPPQPHSLQPAPSRTPAPVSAAPISAAPISAAPISAAPISAAPISAALASQPGAAEFDQEPATVVASSPEGVAAMAHVTSDPFAPPKSSLAQVGDLDEGARKSLVDDIAVGVRKQVRMHPAAYVLIAIAFGFGATGAIVFFTNDRTPAPPPTIQVVTVTAPPVIAAPTEGAPAVSVAMNTEVGPGEVRTGGGTRPVTDGTKSLVEQDPPKVDGKGTAAPRVGLGNGPSIDGPSMTGPGQGPSGNLPQQLDQSDIERVVAAHRVSVRRGCWDPAIAGRSPNAPKSAKVTVSLSIGPSGNVTSASSTGGDGFPGLASCVTGRVRGWKFPPSAGTSQANIPFAFFLQ